MQVYHFRPPAHIVHAGTLKHFNGTKLSSMNYELKQHLTCYDMSKCSAGMFATIQRGTPMIECCISIKFGDSQGSQN